MIQSADYVAFPAGRSGARAVETPSEAVLRILIILTVQYLDVVVFPTEGTFAVRAEGAPDCRRDDGTIEPVLPIDGTARRHD